MTKPQQPTTVPREPWWPPRLASPLWWDDRIAGWHALWSSPARSARRARRAAADPASTQQQRQHHPPRAAGEFAALEPLRQATSPGASVAAVAAPGEPETRIARQDLAIAAAMHELPALRDQVTAQEREIAELRAQLAAFSTRATSADTERQLTVVIAQAAQSRSERDEAVGQLAERDRQIAELRGDLDAIEKWGVGVQNASDNVIRERDALMNQAIERDISLVELTARNDSLRAELNARDGRIADLETRETGLARERDLLNEQIEAYKRTGLAHLDELRQLCAELARRSARSDNEQDDLIARLGRQGHEGVSVHAAPNGVAEQR